MNITYEKVDDYHLFSHEPETRVYLGTASPEDYIWDTLEQQKRSASCGYFNKATGLMAEKPECDLDDDSEFDYKFYEEHEYECSYSYKRRLALTQMGGPAKTCKFVSDDPAVRRIAWSWYFGQTLEEYDKEKADFEAECEAEARRNPRLHNLMWVSGRTYYVDDDGKEISPEEHEVFMKKKFGDDVFTLVEKNDA